MNLRWSRLLCAYFRLLCAFVLLSPAAAEPPLIGGMPPLLLKRKATSHGARREFTSITLLPGRGLNTFQITANLPGKGETELLRSPSLDEAAQKMNGQGDDAFGNLNHSFGGAFLIPFTSRAGGELSADKSIVNVVWHGKTIHLPNDYLGHYSVHGLLNMMKAEDLHVTNTHDGQTLTAVIHAGDFNGYWLSKTDVHFRIALTGDAVDIRVTATNVGDEPEPMGMGWHPFLRIVSGDRAQARVHLPADLYGVVDTIDGRPTGELKPVEGTPKDYRSPQGATMPDASTVDQLLKVDAHEGSGDSEQYRRVACRPQGELCDPRARSVAGNSHTAPLVGERRHVLRDRRTVQLHGRIRCGVEGHGHRPGDAQASCVDDLACATGALRSAASLNR